MDFPDELFEHMAVDWLANDLGKDPDSAEFKVLVKRATVLFGRYQRLKLFMDKPITVWGDEETSDIGVILDTIDKKLTAAEEVLGLTS